MSNRKNISQNAVGRKTQHLSNKEREDHNDDAPVAEQSNRNRGSKGEPPWSALPQRTSPRGAGRTAPAGGKVKRGKRKNPPPTAATAEGVRLQVAVLRLCPFAVARPRRQTQLGIAA